MKPIGTLAFAATLLTALPSNAQVLQLTTRPQHLSVSAGADHLLASPGGVVSLWLDVTPNPKIHVYAQSAKGFTPVALAVSKQPAFIARSPRYPMPEMLASPGEDTPVPAYAKPFRIVQPIVVAKTAKPGQMVSISGTLTYESCDDRLCYPASSLPVYWTINVR